MQSTAEARIAEAADIVDRLRAAFPEISEADFRGKARTVLIIFGTDPDIATIAVREALA